MQRQDKNIRYYEVGGHVFGVTAEEQEDVSGMQEDVSEAKEDVFSLMGNYAPFEHPACDDLLFVLHVVPAASVPSPDALAAEMVQDDEGLRIVAGRVEASPGFTFSLAGELSATMVCRPDFREARVALTAHRKFGLDNALMVLYALAASGHQTALFHAAAVGCDGRAYLFLGQSGTGKSTHARLWLSHVPGSELLNDDNPVVRVLADGQVLAYGSPWSGKTPCYRRRQLPLGALVALSQAPHNLIRPLRPLEAYAVLLPSISGMRWDRQIADGLHQTENLLAQLVPTWHLECLPDAEAARVCYETIKHD